MGASIKEGAKAFPYNIFDTITGWFYKRKLTEQTVLIIMAVLVGLSTGLGAVLFIKLIKFVKGYFLDNRGALTAYIPHGDILITILIPAIGGLLAGPIIYRFAREAKGHGVPEVMEAVALKGGMIRKRVALIKALASAICLGTGGSAGREGPIVQIGSAIGSFVAQAFHMSSARIKILLGCGAAGGIAAVFHAPIAGVFFAVEIILGDYSIRTLTPVIIASVISSMVSWNLLGSDAAFMITEYEVGSPIEIVFFAVLGAVCAFIGVTYVKILYKFEDFFDGMRFPEQFRPMLGGLLLGILACFLPQIMADGYESIEQALTNPSQMFAAVSADQPIEVLSRMPEAMGGVVWSSVIILAILMFAKILATSFTLGSGNSGGIFAPSLFIGAMCGGAFGLIIHNFFPGISSSPGVYALVGMGALVAGTTHAPITAILIIFEMTRDYEIILPLMVAVVFGTLGARRMFAESIYTLKLSRRGINLQSGREVNILNSMHVKETMDTEYPIIRADWSYSKIIEFLQTTIYTTFPVVDYNGHLVGMISYEDLRSVIFEPGLEDLINAHDLATPDPTVLLPEDNLYTALQRFSVRGINCIPVLAHAEGNRLVGVLTQSRTMAAYNREILQREQESKA